MMRLASALALSASVVIPSVALTQPQFPPPPAPGYVYTIPYGGYAAYAGSGLSALAVAGDAYCVGGSASQNVLISKIGISAVATAANTVLVSVIVRSAANTGGTANP